MPHVVTSPVLDLQTAANLLRKAAPDWEWLLRHLESKGGYLPVPKELTEFIDRFKIGNYPLLYQSEASIGNAFVLALFSREELKELDQELNAMSPEERGQAVELLMSGLNKGIEEGEAYVRCRTPSELAAEHCALSRDEQNRVIKSIQWFGMSCLSMFYQVLSVMVHREKLTLLVSRARAGDDSAFVKAIQIDPRILGVDPYFQSRFANLNSEGNEEFRKKLSYRMRCAPYRGKVRHKSLWMGLAFLDMCGHLDSLTYPEMLNLFDEAGIGGYDNRIEDVKYLGKRVNEYRSFQQNSAYVSTP